MPSLKKYGMPPQVSKGSHRSGLSEPEAVLEELELQCASLHNVGRAAGDERSDLEVSFALSTHPNRPRGSVVHFSKNQPRKFRRAFTAGCAGLGLRSRRR